MGDQLIDDTKSYTTLATTSTNTKIKYSNQSTKLTAVEWLHDTWGNYLDLCTWEKIQEWFQQQNKTAMQQLLNQLKEERRTLPMEIEWDRCYQAIEMVIQETYISMEKKQIVKAVYDSMGTNFDPNIGRVEQYYNLNYGK